MQHLFITKEDLRKSKPEKLISSYNDLGLQSDPNHPINVTKDY